MAAFRSSSSSAVAAVCVMMLLCMNIGNVSCDCDINGIINKLPVCLNSIKGSGPPDKNGDCCVALRSIHDTYHPDAACICRISNQQVVHNIGIDSKKAALYLSTCVSKEEVPACLSG